MTPDANTGGDSSNPPVETETEATTVETDDNKQPEPAPEVEPLPEAEEPSTEEQVEETPEQKATREAAEAAADAKLVTDKPEDTKLEFHKHPRFQELVNEKNTYKRELDSLKPLAERTQALDSYCRTNGINEQQIARALEYYRMVNSDPVKAFEMIKADYQQLASITGNVLPPDLEAKVAAGTLDPADAREIALSRGQKTFQQYQQQRQGMTQQQQQVEALNQTVGMWASTKMQNDPDLKEGTPFYNYLHKSILVARQDPSCNIGNMPQVLESLYKEAKQMFATLAPKGRVTKAPLRSTSNNNQNSNAVVKTPEDVARAVLRGMKPHQMKYS